MTRVQEVFKRYEKKYLLTEEQYYKLIPNLKKEMQLDQYGEHTICNIYFDTQDYQLIRTSIEKPFYKEKVRLRSYGTPTSKDMTFIELKKKFDGVVYKRRVPMILETAENYLYYGTYPKEENQILHEVDFTMRKYDLIPAVYLSYNRIALFGKEDNNLRVTFDSKIQGRNSKLHLEEGNYGDLLLKNREVLMELKIPGSMPLWMSHLLSKFSIFPMSFSKYGEYYKQYIMMGKGSKGGKQCA